MTHLKRRGKKVISGVETLSVKSIKAVHEVSKSLIKINGKYLYHELTQKTSKKVLINRKKTHKVKNSWMLKFI